MEIASPVFTLTLPQREREFVAFAALAGILVSKFDKNIDPDVCYRHRSASERM